MDDDDYPMDLEENSNSNPNNINFSSNININTNNLNNINISQNPISFPPQAGINYNQGNNNSSQQFNQYQMSFPDHRHERNILYISDLPYNTNETDIKLFFKRYGDTVSLVKINPKYFENDTRTINAKVIFKDSKTANQARIEMNLRKLKGHAIRLMWEERDNSIRYNSTTNLFVKGIPFNVQPREVYEYFLKFGDISSAKLKDDIDGNHFGYGYVTYYQPESAENAIKNSNGKNIWGGGPVQVDYFKKKNERISTSGPEVFKLYITNFPGDFTESNIIELTKEFGGILSCNIKTEKIGRRYALVCYETEEAANRAKCSLEGKNVNGYNLFCKIINDKTYHDEIHQQKNNINKRFMPRNKPGFSNSNNHMCNLLIKNIPYTIKEKEFYEIFSKFGKIVSAKLETYNLITNIGEQTLSAPTSKGYGYVCYEDQEVAQKVKNSLDKQYLPGYEHWKNPLIIEYFLSKSQKEMSNMDYKKINPLNNYNNNGYMFYPNIQDNFYQNNQNYLNMINYQNSQYNQINQENKNNDNQIPSSSVFDLDKYKNCITEEEKREYLGEIIYEQIFNSPLISNIKEKEKVVSKITGMILESGDREKIIKISNDKVILEANIKEALEIFKQNNFEYN